MTYRYRPLVLIHGLWDNPNIFRTLINVLNRDESMILKADLKHSFGRYPLKLLAEKLDQQIISQLGNKTSIDLLGFSMGGLIGRYWLQKMGGFKRTNSFISVGSPHRGTLTAQLIPSSLLQGIADMKRNSPFLSQLNRDISPLRNVKCISLFCRWDLMVIPGSQAILPIGSKIQVPVSSHRELIVNPISLELIVNELSYS